MLRAVEVAPRRTLSSRAECVLKAPSRSLAPSRELPPCVPSCVSYNAFEWATIGLVETTARLD